MVYTMPKLCIYNVIEAHGYGFRSTVVSGEHSRSKTSAIIAMYDVSTTSFLPDEDPRGRNVVHCNYCTCLAT